MPISPYVNFAGNCREAVEYYARAFKTAPPKFMTFGESPSDPNRPLPEAAKNLIMHTALDIGGTPVMFSDVPPGMQLVAGNNISLTFVSMNRDDILSAWKILSEGATVQMDLQETFWSKLYGFLTDKYGIGWQLSLDSGETF